MLIILNKDMLNEIATVDYLEELHNKLKIAYVCNDGKISDIVDEKERFSF